VIADEIRLLADARQRAAREVRLRLTADRATEEQLVRLRDTLAQHRGTCPAYLHLLIPGKSEAVIELPPELRVAPSEAMLDAVESLFGSGVATLR
jgi:DNA polymerase-3 subunit alpha